MFRKKKDAPEGRRTAQAQPSKNKAVFSYYQNRDTEFDARQSRDKPSLFSRIKSRLRHTPTILAGIVIVASLLYMLSLSDQPSVSVVNEQNVTSQGLRPVDEYQAAAHKLLADSVLNRNKLTLDTTSVESALLEQFSELTNVAIVVPIVSRTPVVYVQVAEPVLALENGGQTFVIDEQGRALLNAATAGDLSELKLIPVKDSATLAIQPGSQVLTGRDVAFMKTVRDQLDQKGMKVARMELPARANEVHVFVEGKPYFIKFTSTGDALQQVGTYIALDKRLAGEKKAPAEYIDVRVDERAYVK